MGLFEVLNDTEKTMMERYIDAYAFNESGNRTASLEYIMRIWNESKQNLFNMFGEQMIISKEILFEKGQEELANEMDHLVWDSDKHGKECVEFMRGYHEFIREHFGDYHDDRNYSLRSMTDTYNLATNVYDGETFEIEGPKSGKMIKVQHGARITRVLGKIAREYDIPYFEEFRIAHSMVLNQKKLKGNLCLSIHPLDFMTMSDNESGWTSCMSWNDYGCYRQGTVEMMNSDMIVVAYLTAKDDMYMPGGYRWSNKKWRQLFIVNPNMIGNIKAYPYRNDDLTKEVLKWLKELAEVSGMGTYTKDVIEYDAFKEFPIEELDNRPIEVSPFTEQMYNDFNNDQWGYFSKDIKAGTYRFCYSGESECMGCGSTDGYFESEGYLTCEDCEPAYRCEWCEETHYSDEGFEWVDGCYMCPDCVADHTEFDFITDERHLTDNMFNLRVSFDGGKTLYDTDMWVHEDTLEESVLGEYFTKLNYWYRVWNRNRYWVDGNYITKEGLRHLGYRDFETFRKNYIEDFYGEVFDPEGWKLENVYTASEPVDLVSIGKAQNEAVTGRVAIAF